MIRRTLLETKIKAAYELRRPLLLEGPIGVGKTAVVLETARAMGWPVVRVDGDARFTEAKLTGTFDPVMIEKVGISEQSFLEGPLVTAMKTGSVLFLNELNRLPEGVQNLLLGVVDEGYLRIPRLAEIHAHPNFRVIATQNPKEFVATALVSEALMDRFDRVRVDYPDEAEEIEMVSEQLTAQGAQVIHTQIERAVGIVRLTRRHPKIRRGASIRAAVALALWVGSSAEELVWREALRVTLAHRIEWQPEGSTESARGLELDSLLEELLRLSVKKSRPSGREYLREEWSSADGERSVGGTNHRRGPSNS